MVAINVQETTAALAGSSGNASGRAARSGAMYQCIECGSNNPHQDVCAIADTCIDNLETLGYLTSGGCAVTNNELIIPAVLNYDVLVFACHGWRTGVRPDGSVSWPNNAQLGFFQAGCPDDACRRSGDFYIGTLGANPGASTPKYDMRNYTWTNVKLAIVFACYSAGGPAEGSLADENPYSINAVAWNLYQQGIQCVIGWHSSLISTDIKWIPRFLAKCDEGVTIQQAADYATNFTDYASNSQIRSIIIYGNGAQTLINHTRSVSAQTLDAADMAQDIDISDKGYAADENDPQSLFGIMQENIPEFNPDDYELEIYPSGAGGSKLMAEPGDFAAVFLKKSGDFASNQGYTLSFRGGNAYRILAMPKVDEARPGVRVPKLTEQEIADAEQWAQAQVIDQYGEDVRIKDMDVQPYWDTANNTYSIRVMVTCRSAGLADWENDEGGIYYYPIGVSPRDDDESLTGKTYNPEIP